VGFEHPLLGRPEHRRRLQDVVFVEWFVVQVEGVGLIVRSPKGRGAKAPEREQDGNIRYSSTPLNQVSSPAPQLRLGDDRDEMSAFKDQTTILVFFRGMGCVHASGGRKSPRYRLDTED
jgi:hypothetical protein